MILSILIPTFNRIDFLKKNIDELISFSENEVIDFEIIISDNNSSDGTRTYLNSIINERVKTHIQKENIGAINNCFFLMERSKSKYIMFLGDDDYLDPSYLQKLLPLLKTENYSCVFPSRLSLFRDGTLKPSMDNEKQPKEYRRGWFSALINSQRATQLSGVVQLKEGLIESYNENKVSNLYPFIYFTIFNCLRGKSYLLPNFPVKITQMVSGEENFDYEKLNLLDHVFDNFHKVNCLTPLKIFMFESYFLYKQPSRYLSIIRQKGFKGFLEFLKNFYSIKKLTFVTKFIFPIIFIVVFIKRGSLILFRR